MREETRTLLIAGSQCRLKLLFIENEDRQLIRDLYRAWRTLTEGMQQFKSRGINFPEGISESAFCLEFNSARVIKVEGSVSGSFDTIDLNTFRRQQIKATSVENDLTSFGPRSEWDELFWLDFYRDSIFDGSFDVYLIPNDLIYNFQVNMRETFRDQQRQGRRPRMRIRREIILPNNISPIGTYRI